LDDAAEVHLSIRSGGSVDGRAQGHAFFAYAANYLVDTDHGVIVDVEATRAIRQAEVGAARTMLERTETRFGIELVSPTADSAYGSADSLAWLVKEKDIAPHIPVFDKSNRTDGTFSPAALTFDPERDCYTCPAGKELVQFRRTYAIPRSGVTAQGTRLYRASKLDCDVCELKAHCCPNAITRKIPRDLHEDARDVARAHAATPEYVEACRRRKKAEMLGAGPVMREGWGALSAEEETRPAIALDCGPGSKWPHTRARQGRRVSLVEPCGLKRLVHVAALAPDGPGNFRGKAPGKGAAGHPEGEAGLGLQDQP
jgi:hypothetical protein